MRRSEMENKLLILLSALILSACATDGPVINTVVQRVEVPIAVPCKAVVPAAPDLSFDKVTPDQDIFDKTKSLLADRKLHLGYEADLLAALSSCIK
jgi:hypothetical protein